MDRLRYQYNVSQRRVSSMVHKTQATTKRPWNTSTRLSERKPRADTSLENHSHSRCTSPTFQSRRKATADADETNTHSKAQPTTSPENPTRAMIERAFDVAFVATMDETDVATSTDTTHEPSPQREPLQETLKQTDDAAKQWRVHYARRREQRVRAAEERQVRDAKAAEFQRAIQAARVQYEQRKLAIQSLQARIQREIQFLEATATELSRRESLLDDAFKGYEQWLQGEIEVNADKTGARAG